MLEFTCSSCGKRVQGDESLAGQRVQCPACNADMMAPAQSGALPVTAIAAADHIGLAKVPLGDGSFRAGEAPLPSGPGRREMPRIAANWGLYLAGAVVVLIVIGLLVPAIQKVRAASVRTQSVNHLKAIGLGFQSFHDANKRLPFNGTQPAVRGDNTSGSWAFQILPFVDHHALFNTRDASTEVPIYLCPGRGRPSLGIGVGGPGAWTDYFLNPFINSPNGVPNAPDIKRTFLTIFDGSSNTIAVGHGQVNPDDYILTRTKSGFTDIIFNGGSPGLCRPKTTVVNSRDSALAEAGNWGGPFAEGCGMCFLDGTARFFPYTITGGTIANGMGPHFGCDPSNPSTSLATYLTPNGGEHGCPD